MLVSIVMPIYNSEKFLKTAIQSILDQTYENFELLLIDDFSSDRSSDIARGFAEKDQRIKFFTNEKNLGICATRNKGIHLSKGDYVTFFDNDDEIDKDLLLDNVQVLIDEKVDAVRFGRVLIDINKAGETLRNTQSFFYNHAIKTFTTTSKYDNYHYFKKNNLLLNIWNGLYKKNIIVEHDLFFDESMKFGSEDAAFSYEFFNACDTIAINPKSYYIHYRRDLSSTSRKYSLNKIDSILKTANVEAEIWQKMTNVKEINYINEYKIQYIKIIISSQLLHKDCDLTKNEKKQIIQQIINNQALKIEGEGSGKQVTLDRILTFLIKRKNVTMLFFLYSMYKRIGGEKWS